MSARRYVRLDELLGCEVRAADGREVGRIEEIRVRRRNDAYEVDEYLLGSGAFFERLALVRRWFKRKPRMLVARWDQVDVRHPDRPVLTCGVEELKHE